MNWKVIGLVAVLGLLVSGLILCIHMKAEPTIIAVFGTAIGVGATGAFKFLTGNGDKSGPAAVIFVAGTSLLAGDGCAPLVSQSKALEAEAAYKEQQRDCIRQYDNDEQIDACRRKVREDWGIVETVARDAGKDGAR